MQIQNSCDENFHICWHLCQNASLPEITDYLPIKASQELGSAFVKLGTVGSVDCQKSIEQTLFIVSRRLAQTDVGRENIWSKNFLRNLLAFAPYPFYQTFTYCLPL